MVRVRQIFLTVLALLLVLFGMLFTLNNQQPVALDFLVYRTPAYSLALWLVLSVILGGILGVVATSFSMLKSRLARRRTERQLKRSEKSLKKQRRDAAKSIE